MNSVELLRLQAIVNEYKEHDDMFEICDFVCRDFNIKLDQNKDKWPGLIFTIGCSVFNNIRSEIKFDDIKKAKMTIADPGEIHIMFDRINDLKAFLFDIRFFAKAAAPHAMKVTVTDTKYCIRQYFGDEDRKILIWEITNNEFKCKEDRAVKIYMLTESLLKILDEDIFESYSSNIVSILSYGPNFNKNTDDFKYPDYILDAISRYDIAMTPKRDELL